VIERERRREREKEGERYGERQRRRRDIRARCIFRDNPDFSRDVER
jgi:hypothetical protein